jgi:DnaD/phage-associated family protein
MKTILGWITDYDAAPELIAQAFRYCASLGKTDTRYVGSVVISWVERGLATKEDVENYLQENDQRHAVIRRVMRALGFTRNATEAESEMISAWIDELGCSMDDILNACSKTSGISNPNINYVDRVLRNKTPRKQGQGRVSRNLVMEYYEKLRNKAADEAAQRKQQVYEYVPRIGSIDNELRECNMELTRNLFSGEGGSAQITHRIEQLEKERLRLLTENDIPVDYMDIRPNCRICADTGITKEGSRCSCYEEVARRASEEAN